MILDKIMTLALVVLVVPVLALGGAVDNTELTIPKPHQTVYTSITEYTDQASWEAAVSGAIAVNPYGDLPAGVIVTNQYLALGALYTDGDDDTFLYGDSIDGMLLRGNGRINVDFTDPVYAVAVNYPGAVAFTGYLGGAVVFASSDFGGSGSGMFAGIVSTDAFDSLEIRDWVDDSVYIDDLNYDQGTVATEARSLTRVKALFD